MAEFDSLRKMLFDGEGRPTGWFFALLLAASACAYFVYKSLTMGM